MNHIMTYKTFDIYDRASTGKILITFASGAHVAEVKTVRAAKLLITRLLHKAMGHGWKARACSDN